MYAQVMLLNGFGKPLWYQIPKHLQKDIHLGSIVNVPLQRRKEAALITLLTTSIIEPITFQIKEINGLSIFPKDNQYHYFLQKLSNLYFCTPLYFYQRIRHFLHEKDHTKQELETSFDLPQHSNQNIEPTDEQSTIINYLKPIINNPTYAPTLVHGVTGSGKTEVYKKLIETAIAIKKSVILLLPEVTLALQFVYLLRHQLPHIHIIGFHSATKIAEKRELWHALVHAKPILIIGVHLPILLPINNLGLIIIDEEHELGFQEKKHPKLHSKQIALLRAHHYNLPILLGSATPSLTTLYNVEKRRWKMFSMTKRFSGQLPTIQKIILTQKPQQRRKTFWISNTLEQAIRERLIKKEQVIIFLNRRGYSFFVQCKTCGFIMHCLHCSVSLTLHVSTQEILRCHYCEYQQTMPQHCPSCNAPEKEFLKKGIGTQQIVRILQELFPQAKIERADMDTTSKKRSWQSIVDAFKAGAIDILVGTQTITKGYHFPKVTLVGVLWADLNLHFPVYYASETTLQQLIQVAGRAGRQSAGGHVIIQAMHDHQIFDYLDEKKYLNFCASELQERHESFYPPFARLACIELKNVNADQIDKDAQQLVTMLHDYNKDMQLEVTILGPAFPIVRRIQNFEMRNIILKSTNFKALHTLLAYAHQNKFESNLFILINE